MRKLLVVALAILAIVAPVAASADSVGYLQGQQNQVVVGASQSQLYIGFAGQSQAGVQQSVQQQVSVNHADSLTAVVVFGFPVLVVGQSVNANGANTQGQASGYFQTQGGAGLALGLQTQGIVQSQGQFQLSTGSGSN